jgi:hypothetical protein
MLQSLDVPNLSNTMKTTTLTFTLLALFAVTAMADENTRKALYGDALFFADTYKGDDFAKSFIQTIKVLTPEHTAYIK